MVLYYSATGNSAHVARRIAASAGLPMLNLLEKLRTGDHTPLESDGPWVIVAPTYAWQLPHIVRDWLLATPLQGSRDIYFVLTCGDSIGAASITLQQLAAQMHMKYRGTAGITMPENYIALFQAPDLEEARVILRDARGNIRRTAQTIAERKPLREAPPHAIDKFLSGPINRFFYNHVITAKKFHTTDACTGCGHCADVCPMNNITLTDGKPVWSSSCTHCMACMCTCPTHAVEYGRASSKKVRYTCPEP